MSKRKLSRRQAWRIEKIQKEREKRSEKLEKHIAEQSQEGHLGPEQKGLVIAHFGTLVEVEPIDQGCGDQESGDQESDDQSTSSKTLHQREDERVKCHMRANLGNLVAGDRVIWCKDAQDSGVIVARKDRSSELSRPNMHGELKPVASNIDQIVVVVAPEPEAHANLIDRYLVAAEFCNIEPLLLLNKTDLLNADNRAHFEGLVNTYQQLGYQTLTGNTVSDEGLDELKQRLDDKVSVFAGQSGVGKSSIIQKLLPNEDIRVGALSEASKKGRHTTTTARLFHMASGGDLIDSPGIREFGLWHVEPNDVLRGFRELAEYDGYCKFRNCSHKHEPKCAILAALSEGKITQTRYDSFIRIVDSLSDVDIRQ